MTNGDPPAADDATASGDATGGLPLGASPGTPATWFAGDNQPDPAHRPRVRRSWGQRSVLAVNVVVVMACFIGAGFIWFTAEKANDSKVVTLTDPRTVGLGDDGTGGAPTTAVDTGPVIPELEDTSARNFLITGTDNGACVDPTSPYAGAFGERFGDRSDTIMVLRIDPETGRAAILSFPRDLWVTVAGSSRESRINGVFKKDDPSLLIFTIYENFGIVVDHYVNIDFCAFKKIVDAVGGVKVPFEYAVRDENTGLAVPSPQCYRFDGESGLAYVRSRYFEYLDPATGAWRQDPTSDLGRISRQQDFVRRLMKRAIAKGVRDPRIAKKIIDASIEFVTRDDVLTIGRLLQLGQAMRDLDPDGIQTYQIEVYPVTIGGQAVLDPRLDGANMQAVLAVFRGEAQLATAPEQQFDPGAPVTTTTPATTTPTTSTSVAAPPTSGSSTSASSTAPTGPTTTLPPSNATEIVKGIVPTDDPDCT
jgi:LCP family protein required for cell wall assembly